MKVLHVTNWLPGCHHISGGAEAVCLNTIDMALQAGHECEVFCLPLDLPSPHRFPVHEADLVLHHLPRRLYGPADFVRTHYWPLDGYAARSLRRVLQRLKPDLVHFHKFERLGYSVVRAAAAWGVPTLWSIYDYLAFCPNGYLLQRSGAYCREGQGRRCYYCYHPGRRLPWLQRAGFGRRGKLVLSQLRHLHRVIVLSKRSREIAADQGVDPAKLRVIHQSYPVAATEPVRPDEQRANLIFFAGWLGPAKGLHIILEAMPQVLEQQPQAHLLALGLDPGGGPEYGVRLEKIVRANHLEAAVTMLGRLPRREFLRHLRQSSVVVVPEQWENMSPVIVVEAMAHGLPLVASRVGGIPEFVRDGHTGYLARPDSPVEFAQRILEMLSDPERARAMGARGRELALAWFDRAVVGRQLLDTYEELRRER